MHTSNIEHMKKYHGSLNYNLESLKEKDNITEVSKVVKVGVNEVPIKELVKNEDLINPQSEVKPSTVDIKNA